jgi:hypothetical protein
LLCLAALGAGALAVSLAAGVSGTHASSPATSGPLAEPVAQTDDSVPAREVTMIGATPAEQGAGADETWGLGNGASGAVVVRYAVGSEGQGEWTLAPGLQEANGQALTGFALDTPEAQGKSAAASPLAGQMTADGSGVLAGFVQQSKQVVLVREPGNPENPFRETDPGAEAQLEPGERLLSFTRAPLIAPLDEAGGHAGALVVPVKEPDSGVEESVLHWEGAAKRWSREPIELPASAGKEFRVLGIGASSPTNAWLLGQLSSGVVTLFRREAGGGEVVWRPVALEAHGTPGEPLRIAGEDVVIPGARSESVRNQVLTVTSQGVWVDGEWIDGEHPDVRASATVFFEPEGEGAGQPTQTSWCTVESPLVAHQPCTNPLPEALPTGPSRSIAWANASSATPFGERVITGLSEGESLRLEGHSFQTVLALGGSSGSAYGAAFSGAREGWLGDQRLPVHLTLDPAPDELEPWPVSFRRPLLAIAPAPPEPEHPVGSLSSGALAVGDDGEVARYEPGIGWTPESLIGANGRVQTPRLRAVAWPTPSRAYAVGNEGQMWLWRGETGRWEPDPAAPYQFEGNLLGVAFDPSEPARGFAVGQGGVLLAYGKTWTQVPTCAGSVPPPCLPPEVAGASFTSVAFAGSEAIVAYRILPNKDTNHYIGGLLVNEGGEWQVDKAAAQAMGSNVPWAVAGLPEGGAAFGASDVVYEREGPSAPWQATPTPLPGGTEPGSLALFREGEALRAVVAGSVPNTYSVEKELEAPPGTPATLIEPYPLANNLEAGVLRQTAGGWRDEEHELNGAREPPGNWSFYDTVYEPDPVSAVLIDASGSHGWAVGGYIEGEPSHEGLLDTADAYRIGDEPPPTTENGTSPIAVEPGRYATFAIGGNAQCAAPCAARAGAKIGPDVWLSAALQHAAVTGVRAFLYTGPRLVDPKAISGPRVAADQISYAQELERYDAILAASPLPVFAAITPTDRNEEGLESTFETELGSKLPLGGGQSSLAELSTLSRPESCDTAPNCQSAYYAFTSKGSAGSVRVIVLDDASEAGEIEAREREWLASELTAAAKLGLPAIVVGNADLSAEQAAGNHPGATEVVRILVEGEGQAAASAYFFDSPEQNIEVPLTYGQHSIPSFGSGTLGYVNYQAEKSGAFHGASGFLLAQVDAAAADRKAGNVAPVTAQLIPNIEELALDAKSGTLLRRSQVAVFAGLARRPRAGNRSAAGGAPQPETDPYIPIPSTCRGATCATATLPVYTFTSSNPEVGNFVKPDLTAEPNGEQPELGAGEVPIADPKSGLFCAYKAGETTVTITAGGLFASLPVTVQQGSVRQPCGPGPAGLPVLTQHAAPAPAPTPLASGPAAAASASPPIPPPPAPPLAPTAPASTPPPARPPHLLAAVPFFIQPALTAPVIGALPPPPPAPTEPTPPGGFSGVTSPVEAPQREEDKEEATESARANASAYSVPEQEPVAPYLLGLIVLAAFAGAVGSRRIRGGRRAVRVAPATLSTIRSQRSLGDAARRSDRRPFR